MDSPDAVSWKRGFLEVVENPLRKKTGLDENWHWEVEGTSLVRRDSEQVYVLINPFDPKALPLWKALAQVSDRRGFNKADVVVSIDKWPWGEVTVEKVAKLIEANCLI